MNLTASTPKLRDSIFKFELDFPQIKVINIPTIQITEVLQIFSSDLVRASNTFVIRTPLKLYRQIERIPKTTSTINCHCEKTYFM